MDMNTKNIISMQPRKTRVIKKELLINGGDLDLYLDVFLTDKEGKTERIVTKKADSILANFMRILYVMMGRDVRTDVLGSFQRLGVAFSGANIVSITAGAGSVFRITGTSNFFTSLPSSGLVTLGGFKGITLDGKYTYTKFSASAIDIDGTVYAGGWVAGTGGGAAYIPTTNIGYPSDQAFENQGIVIGTGDDPVTIDDQLLEKQVPNGSSNGSLTYGPTIVSQDTNDSVSAQITITRTFTNNATDIVAVSEIGYLMKSGDSDYVLMVMRDILPTTQNVGIGATLTVNYRIKTVLGTGTDPGGFIVSFMRLLYRHMGQTTRAIFDIDNVSRSFYPSYASFCAVYSGGISKQNPNDGEVQYGYKYGIVLGRGNTSVSMGDYYLETPIEHGEGTNQMLYYGGFSEGFLVGSTYAEFSIMKAIENNSGASINVNEYILVCASDDPTVIAVTSKDFANLFAVTRNVLSSPITVLDQEILKVIYTLRCVVGGSSS
jgi:hypothetical protein